MKTSLTTTASRLFLPFVGVILVATAGNSSAQEKGEPEREARVRNTVANLLTDAGIEVDQTVPLSDAPTHKQARLSWQSSSALNSTDANKLEQWRDPGTLTLVTSARRDGAASRDRALELSEELVLVVALDENGGLRWWKPMLDPRLVRAETVTATGEIHGESFYRAKADFTVEYPDDARITQLRFYHPSWDGKGFHLESLALLTVR